MPNRVYIARAATCLGCVSMIRCTNRQAHTQGQREYTDNTKKIDEEQEVSPEESSGKSSTMDEDGEIAPGQNQGRQTTRRAIKDFRSNDQNGFRGDRGSSPDGRAKKRRNCGAKKDDGVRTSHDVDTWLSTLQAAMSPPRDRG